MYSFASAGIEAGAVTSISTTTVSSAAAHTAAVSAAPMRQTFITRFLKCIGGLPTGLRRVTTRRSLSFLREGPQHRRGGVPRETPLQAPGERVGEAGQRVARPGEGEDVVPYAVVRPVPLDQEPLLAV